MLSLIRTAAVSAIQRQINRFFPPAAPQLAGFPLGSLESSVEGSNNAIEESIWFAVPKSKVSRGKKRMKTTLQKRIKLKDNIVIGEYYLRRIQLALEPRDSYIFIYFYLGRQENGRVDLEAQAALQLEELFARECRVCSLIGRRIAEVTGNNVK